MANDSKDPLWFPTLFVLWRHLQDIRKASDWGLAHWGGMTGKFDLELGRVDEDTGGEMDSDRIANKKTVRHLFCFWFVWSLKKLSCVGKLMQRVHMYVDRSSRIISFITCMQLEKETGRIVLVAMVVASLAVLSASSLPWMAEWPGIHWMKMNEEMELMELRIGDVREFGLLSA